jgi:catechol 2,3-dioxygenase-like lactoylglutathione lyase family enzyme
MSSSLKPKAPKRTGMTPKYKDRVGGNIKCDHIPTPEMFDPDVVRPAYLSHIVLHSKRVPEVAAWWRTLLGARTTVALDNYALLGPDNGDYRFDAQFITFDGEHHRIAIAAVTPVNDRPGAATSSVAEATDGVKIPGAHSPLGHISFTYASLGDLVATYRRLKKSGLAPVRMLHHGPTVSLYYEDPDGNSVELQVNAFRSMKELDEWFVSGNFDRNPIGLTYDFEDLARRYDEGVDPDYLCRPDGYIREHADKEQ